MYGKCDCFLVQMMYVCVLCSSCGSSQCCILYFLKIVNAIQECKTRSYGRGILHSLYHGCLIVSAPSVYHTLLFIYRGLRECFFYIIYGGVCACTEML